MQHRKLGDINGCQIMKPLSISYKSVCQIQIVVPLAFGVDKEESSPTAIVPPLLRYKNSVDIFSLEMGTSSPRINELVVSEVDQGRLSEIQIPSIAGYTHWGINTLPFGWWEEK